MEHPICAQCRIMITAPPDVLTEGMRVSSPDGAEYQITHIFASRLVSSRREWLCHADQLNGYFTAPDWIDDVLRDALQVAPRR